MLFLCKLIQWFQCLCCLVVLVHQILELYSFPDVEVTSLVAGRYKNKLWDVNNSMVIYMHTLHSLTAWRVTSPFELIDMQQSRTVSNRLLLLPTAYLHVFTCTAATAHHTIQASLLLRDILPGRADVNTTDAMSIVAASMTCMSRILWLVIKLTLKKHYAMVGSQGGKRRESVRVIMGFSESTASSCMDASLSRSQLR